MDPTKEKELTTRLCQIIENGHISTEQLKIHRGTCLRTIFFIVLKYL